MRCQTQTARSCRRGRWFARIGYRRLLGATDAAMNIPADRGHVVNADVRRGAVTYPGLGVWRGRVARSVLRRQLAKGAVGRISSA